MTSLYNCVSRNQVVVAAKEGSSMVKKRIEVFVDDLIREYADHKSDGYYLSVCDIPHEVLKVYLSVFVSPNDYEYYAEDPVRLNLAIKDYKHEMQYFINKRLDVVYYEDMDELGLHFKQLNNGDAIWDR